MARKLRIEYKGAIYHVTVRANGGADLFVDDTDRRYLLDRIGEAAEVYQVRVYLFCLMSNHFHFVAETPRGNLGRFMQSVLTGYGVYYNRRHQSHGHVTQGRYGARLVEGNEYLLKLSRYVHLNPVKVAGVVSKPLVERLDILRKHSWSSYPSYTGLSPRNEFVDYEPILTLVGGRKKDRDERYREFVEAGVATTDEEFAAALWRSAHSIGSEDFREDAEERYRELLEEGHEKEDVSFRRTVRGLDVERILTVVESVSGVAREELLVQQRDCRWRAVAARVLCRYGGLTQRAAAKVLGMRTGVAVSCQLRRLTELAAMDKALRRTIEKIEAELDQEQHRKGC
jgi:REP element-mobilizing transposase RayT